MNKNLWINIGLAFGSLCLFFLAGEVLLRVTGLQTTKPNPPKIYQQSTNAVISYELIPSNKKKAYRSTVITNDLGFRSPAIDATKPLLAVLGDSIVFGYGVENDQTLSAALQEFTPEYFVLNAGVPGYNLAQETEVYRTKIAPLEPAALIAVFHYNDLTTNTAFLGDDGIIHDQGWEPTESICDPIVTGMLGYLPGKCWLDLHSAFYKALKKLINLRYMNEQLQITREESKQNPTEDDVTPQQIANYTIQLQAFAAQLPTEMPRIFVIWPDRQLHPTSRPQIRAIAEANGFVVVDLYDTFGNEAETLGWDTVHPSVQTTRTAAEVLHSVVHSLAIAQ